MWVPHDPLYFSLPGFLHCNLDFKLFWNGRNRRNRDNRTSATVAKQLVKKFSLNLRNGCCFFQVWWPQINWWSQNGNAEATARTNAGRRVQQGSPKNKKVWKIFYLCFLCTLIHVKSILTRQSSWQWSQ